MKIAKKNPRYFPKLPALTLTVKAEVSQEYLQQLPKTRDIFRWGLAARRVHQRDLIVTVSFLNEQAARELNRDYRDKDYATNVLTFVINEEEEFASLPLVVDVVLCAQVVAREANERGISFLAHCAHLIVHAFLHAQGFEHDTDAQAQAMERLETQILARLGVSDPYHSEVQ